MIPSHTDTAKERGFLYLLRDPTLPEGVFKIGRTNNPRRRLSEYPKGSTYICTFGRLVDCHESERRLLLLFRHRFSRYPEKGTEYFVGDTQAAIRAFAFFCHEDPSPMLT